jgi:DnaJ-class molecular chaperone
VASDKRDKQSDSDDVAEESHGPQECMPCRGIGELVSNLDEKTSTVACPWCEGTGKRIAGIDAQQTWLAQETDDEPSGASADAAA